MKNKKLLLGIGIVALVLILGGGLFASNSGLFQGKVRNLRAPKSVSTPATLPSAPPPASSMTSSGSNSLAPTVDLLINGTNGPGVLVTYPITLSWSSTAMSSCSGSTQNALSGFTGQRTTSGSLSLPGMNFDANLIQGQIPTATFKLTCLGIDGANYEDSVNLRVDLPEVNFLINGGSTVTAEVGTEVTLSWTSDPDVVFCGGYSAPGWGGQKLLNSSETYTVTESTTLLLACHRQGLSAAGLDRVTIIAIPVN